MEFHNRRRAFLALSVSAALLVQGCASGGAFASPQAGTDYGDPPTDFQSPIRAHFEQTLKDPESARYRFGTIQKAYLNEGLLYGGGIAWYGHMVVVEVNAKNSYGGFVGYKPYMVLFSRGTNNVHRVREGSSHTLLHYAN